MDVSSVSAIDPATPTAPKLIDILKVVGPRFTGVPYDDLPVLVHETDCGCTFFHDVNLTFLVVQRSYFKQRACQVLASLALILERWQ